MGRVTTWQSIRRIRRSRIPIRAAQKDHLARNIFRRYRYRLPIETAPIDNVFSLSGPMRGNIPRIRTADPSLERHGRTRYMGGSSAYNGEAGISCPAQNAP